MDPEQSERRMTPEALATILRADIEHYDNVMRQNLERLYRLLLLVFPVGGLALTALYGYEQYVILLSLPILSALSILAAGSLTAEMFALAAHKYFIEESLSAVLGAHLPPELSRHRTVPWDDVGGTLARTSMANWLLWRACPIFVVAGGTAAIAIAWSNLGPQWYLAACCLAVTVPLYGLSLIALAKGPSIYHETLMNLQALRDRGGRRVSWPRGGPPARF